MSLTARGQKPALFVKIDVAGGPLRLWSGFGRRLGSPDEPEAVYLGGRLLNWPDLVQLADGRDHRIDLRLRGSDPDIRALMGERADEVPGAIVTLQFCAFDAQLQPLTELAWPMWKAPYEADTVALEAIGRSAVVVLSAGSAFARRRRPANAYWTPADQQALFPGDRICERVPALNEGVTKTKFHGR